MKLVQPSSDREFHAIVQTMVAVVTLEGREPMVPLERMSVEQIARQIFDRDIDIDSYDPAIPADLEQVVRDPELRLFAVRMMMTLPLVGGEVSRPRIDLVERIARRLDARGEEFALLERAARGSWTWFIWRLMKHGVEEYWAQDGKPRLRDWAEIFLQLLGPSLFAKPAVAERYASLRRMPADTLGGTLARYYVEKKFPLPGERGGTNEKFALHDFYHIISGYRPETGQKEALAGGAEAHANDVRGEVLVSVFTGGNKAYHPMDWVIVPLLQWHCGKPVITYKKNCATRNLLDPEAYFRALRRGMEMRVNLMDRWNWWDHIAERVEDVRRDYHVLPLDPALIGERSLPASVYNVDRAALRRPSREALAAAAE